MGDVECSRTEMNDGIRTSESKADLSWRAWFTPITQLYVVCDEVEEVAAVNEKEGCL